jgi:FkbM family methyltransferase
MSVSKSQRGALTGVYSLARRSGLLDTRPGQWLFSRTYYFYKRHLEDPFRPLAARHPEFFQGGHVLDIGANIGYTSSVFALSIDPAYKVYSFEPEAFNLCLLDRLAQSRRAQGRIVPVHAAVGDEDGSIQLWRNQDHHADHRVVTSHFREVTSVGASVQVPMLKIDTFVAQQAASFPVRFIKVDVQGYELPVLKGMQRTLESNPNVILALEYAPDEIRELGFRPEDLLDWLAARNYQSYSVARDGSMLPTDGPALGTQPYIDLLFIR